MKIIFRVYLERMTPASCFHNLGITGSVNSLELNSLIRDLMINIYYIFFQRKLGSLPPIPGSWIDLQSCGGLVKPTDQVLEWVRLCDKAFNQIHGQNAVLKTGRGIQMRTTQCILSLHNDIPEDVISLFVKVKYHARCWDRHFISVYLFFFLTQ